MATRGLDPFSTAETAAMVGDGVAVLIARAFAARGRTDDPDAVAEFAADYTLNCTAATRLFPGVRATLGALQSDGWRLAVCTNKLEAPTRKLLSHLGIAALFAAVGAGDSFPVRKPDPAHLLATLSAAGGAGGRAVMAGDHRNDVRAAHGAGMPCIFAAWGYGTAEMGADADAVSARFADLPAIARRLLG